MSRTEVATAPVRPEAGGEVDAAAVRLPAKRPIQRVLRRPEQGRVIAGVCAGLAAYFGRPVWLVRLISVLLGLLFGLGGLLYMFWWVTIPSGDPDSASLASRPAALSRLAPRLNLGVGGRVFQRREVTIGLLLLGVAAVWFAIRNGWNWQHSWLPPAGLTVGGLMLAWSQADAASQAFDGESGARRSTATRVLGGVALMVVGVLMVFGHETPNWAMIQSAAAAIAVLLGVGLVFAPWWLRLVQALGEERAARVRAAERADIAAHLHDSVLQTLALIRANASDADAVSRISRAQERDLREWLYTDRAAPGTSFAAEVRSLIAQVEDGKIGKTGAAPATTIDVVVVGDCQPTDTTDALLQATREALVNAVAHGSPPISVYLEVTDKMIEVFVRDRGSGFDPLAIAPDRFGVRQSIIGRMQRRGGSAEVVSRPDWGTEVRLKMPRTGG